MYFRGFNGMASEGSCEHRLGAIRGLGHRACSVSMANDYLDNNLVCVIKDQMFFHLNTRIKEECTDPIRDLKDHSRKTDLVIRNLAQVIPAAPLTQVFI